MINWHYPRPALANQHLEQLFDQGISRLAFFGRRRIGKTEYLQQDLIPAAELKNIRTIYCSFWENKDKPHLALIRALQHALPGAKWTPKKFGVALSSEGGVEINAEIERAERPRAALPDELSQIANLFSEWTTHLKGKPALIVLDEIQHLATSSHFATFAASLRTLLDMAPRSIRVVFTGSSLADLKRLFQDSKAPFFNFATVIDFPPLGREFVDHLTKIHHQITALQLPADDLFGLFEEVGHNAQLITGLVEKLVLHKTNEWRHIWSEIEGELTGEGGWCQRIWEGLALSDRTVYLRLLEDKDLFSEESLAIYQHLGFSRGTAQQAVKRLINASLIHHQAHGEYQRIIPIFDEWIRKEGLRLEVLPAPHSGD
jgi:uncharacterized protein